MQPSTPVQTARGGADVAQDLVMRVTDENVSNGVGGPPAKKKKGRQKGSKSACKLPIATLRLACTEWYSGSKGNETKTSPGQKKTSEKHGLDGNAVYRAFEKKPCDLEDGEPTLAWIQTIEWPTVGNPDMKCRIVFTKDEEDLFAQNLRTRCAMGWPFDADSFAAFMQQAATAMGKADDSFSGKKHSFSRHMVENFLAKPEYADIKKYKTSALDPKRGAQATEEANFRVAIFFNNEQIGVDLEITDEQRTKHARAREEQRTKHARAREEKGCARAQRRERACVSTRG